MVCIEKTNLKREKMKKIIYINKKNGVYIASRQLKSLHNRKILTKFIYV